MKIINQSELITDDQINDVVDLLPISHRAKSIYIFEYEEDAKKFLRDNKIAWHIKKDILNKDFDAMYVPSARDIYISVSDYYEDYENNKHYPNVTPDDINKLIFVVLLVHELRHAHQENEIVFNKNHKLLKIFEITSFNLSNSRVEKDADNFTRDFMIDNYRQIRDILKLNISYKSTLDILKYGEIDV